MTEKEYGKLVTDMGPRSPIGKDCLKAFLIGGLICCVGQLIMNGYMALNMDKTDAGTATSMTLVAISALLTGSGHTSLLVLPFTCQAYTCLSAFAHDGSSACNAFPLGIYKAHSLSPFMSLLRRQEQRNSKGIPLAPP